MKRTFFKNHRIATLSSGMRVVVCPTQSPVSYVGVAINAGSRDELASAEGVAHFVEHTLFKGTPNRTAAEISDFMESVGGELNAYTSKEETVIYTIAPKGNVPRALDLLSDIIFNSEFPANELDKERDVVIEEIYSYLDSPADRVYDEFDELIYRGSTLAHNILGTPASVKQLSTADCRNFTDYFYAPQNMVLYIYAGGDAHKHVELAEEYFGGPRQHFPGHMRTTPPIAPVFDEVRDNDGHQSHTIIGTRLFGRNDPRRFALFLLNNYLGGPCMNSLLNRELREKRGLVYTVDSTVSLLSDAGIMQIYFGTDRENVDRCRKIIAETLDSLAQNQLSPEKLDAIKTQYCGQLMVSTDHRESMAMSLGKSVLYYGDVHDPLQTAHRVTHVNAEQIREVAELCASANCSRLTIC